MNFVDYTLNLLDSIGDEECTLLAGAGFQFCNVGWVIQNDPEKDLNEWITEYRNSAQFERFDFVILSRVLEHFPQRSLDWYLYNIYTTMEDGGTLICVVPDMKACADALSNEFKKKKPNMFLVNRLTYELLSEGDNVWDRHATWTCKDSIKKYLEMEGLFKVKEINKIRIDSNIVPHELEVIARRR